MLSSHVTRTLLTEPVQQPHLTYRFVQVRQEAAAAATAQKQQEAAAKAASAPSASASQASGSCGLEQGMQRLAVASSSSSSGCSVSGCSVPGSRPPAASAAGGLTGAGCAAVQELQALSGGALAPEFLQHVLLRCFGGDLEASAAAAAGTCGAVVLAGQYWYTYVTLANSYRYHSASVILRYRRIACLAQTCMHRLQWRPTEKDTRPQSPSACGT